MMTGRDARFAGTVALVRLVLRRDRIRLPVWIVSLSVLMVTSTQSVWALYDTPALVTSYVDSVGGNPALVLFAGPGYGFDTPTVGAILVNETSLWMALANSLMGIFLVVRHTRAEEDAERADLVRSVTVGRDAQTTAVCLVALGANLVVGVVSAVGAILIGFPVVGSIALCASFPLVGLAFAATAAIGAQLAPTARSALGLAAGLLGGAFVLRGVGDIGASALSWLTPFGWGIGVRAFAHERWWTLFGLVVFVTALTRAAFWLSAHRDLGSGVFGERPGPGRAAPWMSRPIGLLWRLQRASVVGWSVGLLLTALVYGSLGDEIAAMVRENPQLAEYLAQLQGVSVVDAYLATAMKMLALLATGFALSSFLRAASSEGSGYTEMLLATRLSRPTWVRSHLAFMAAGTLVVTAFSGLGLGVSYALVTNDPSQVPRLLGAGMGTLPAILVVVGIAALLFGWLPRFSLAVWGIFAAVVAIEIFGDVLGLPSNVRELSPFGRIAAMPAESWDPASALVMLGVAAGLMVFGEWGFRRRDLQGE